VPGYAALYALASNVVLSIVLSLIFNTVSTTKGGDQTVAADYRFR
jgi:hypothetical protein